jgi:DegV family protein with EDD domain
MTIRIVTDSTCDLSPEVAARHEIVVLPAYINVGKESYQDGVTLTREQFYSKLPDFPSHPTTAVPSAGMFAETYRELARSADVEILSIHIAGDLSGMLNAARLGSEMAPEATVTLYDSGQLSMGLGLLVLLASDAVRQGMDMPALVSYLDYHAERTHTYAALATLEYLRRSGRVSWAQFGMGTLLSVKLILHVYRGKIEFERVRTTRKAHQYLQQQLAARAPFSQLAILHTANRANAETFGQEIRRYLSLEEKPMIAEVTPTIGVHVGPGGLGFAGIVSN